MLLLDIDNTIAQSEVTPALERYWNARGGYTVKEAGFLSLAIANYTLETLQEVDDLFILSTWGEYSQLLLDAFDIKAEILDYKNYSFGLTGIEGKFEVVKMFASEVRLWADDHITNEMKKYCDTFNIKTVIPNPETAINLEEIKQFTLTPKK